MTERMSTYLKLLAEGDTITKGIVILVLGLMGLWWIWTVQPIKFLRRLAGGPFWTFITILFVFILVGLLFIQVG
jgi:hypothetical protein